MLFLNSNLMERTFMKISEGLEVKERDKNKVFFIENLTIWFETGHQKSEIKNFLPSCQVYVLRDLNLIIFCICF